MARKPKPRSEVPATSNKLLEALEFLSLITKDVGAPNETHVSLSNGWATAFNGILAAGQKIEDNMFASPHNQTMVEALSKCGQNISIIQLDQYRLQIKSEKFKAIVPCIDPVTLEIGIPDIPITIVDNKFKQGLEAVEVLTVNDGQEVYLVSILMNGHSLISCNGPVFFEYWHGIDLPPNLAIPKSFAQALIKSKKNLAKFGFSQSSVTFYFHDDSWIKTQLFAKPWPQVQGILDRPCNAYPLPPDFFKGLAAVAPFSADGLIHFEAGVMRSHPSSDTGASYEVQGLPGGLIFAAKQLLLLKPHIQTVDFMADGNRAKMLMFFGPNIRGAIAGRLQ